MGPNQIIDAEFEVVTEADREVSRPEAWQVEPGKSIPAFPDLKSRLRHYWFGIARILGADDEFYESTPFAQGVWVAFTLAFWVALVGALMWIRGTIVNNPPA